MRDRKPMLRPHAEPKMELPPGKTCADCCHFKRCSAMFGHVAADEVCDFYPSRFAAIAQQRGSGEGGCAP